MFNPLKKKTMAKKSTNTKSLIIPPIPIREGELLAFATAVELDMGKIQKMINAIIQYNSTCSKAAHKLESDLKNIKIKRVYLKKH